MPRWVWRAGGRHRVRLINITPDDILSVSLRKGDTTVTWRPLTKDGVPVPTVDGPPVPATVTIAVGETYDFEYRGPGGSRDVVARRAQHEREMAGPGTGDREVMAAPSAPSPLMRRLADGALTATLAFALGLSVARRPPPWPP